MVRRSKAIGMILIGITLLRALQVVSHHIYASRRAKTRHRSKAGSHPSLTKGVPLPTDLTPLASLHAGITRRRLYRA